MKLRIRGNSVRIRLMRSEVERLGAGQRVEQTTYFSPSAKLVSAIQVGIDIAQAIAQFDGNEIRISLPAAQVAAWCKSDQVAIETDQQISGDRMLTILVEKDFQCLHTTREECADAYPNPNVAVN